MRLSDKVAVITGGNRGIGRAIALGFAREGAHIVVNYLRGRDEAHEVADMVRDIGRKALLVKADISNYIEVDNMAEKVFLEFGKVDILVNNAGILIKNSLIDTSPEKWDKVVSVNLNGVFYSMKIFGAKMVSNGGGSIINISSVAGYIPLINAGAYSATKAAVIMLTRQAAVEWGSRGVRVNAICPGPILTDMLLSEYTSKELQIRRRLTPLMKLGKPEDIADLAVFLASDDSGYVTGEAYGIDGGLSNSTYFLLHKLLGK